MNGFNRLCPVLKRHQQLNIFAMARIQLSLNIKKLSVKIICRNMESKVTKIIVLSQPLLL